MNAELKAFLVKHVDARLPRSANFLCGHLSSYMRAGPYHVEEDGVRMKAVGIARVDLWPAQQGKGEFKRFIIELEQVAKELGYEVIRVEQVHNEKLADGLLRNGYTPHTVFEDVFCKKL